MVSIGWAARYRVARLHFLILVGILAGFFDNPGKQARFRDLSLELFLPMPI
jgi:hypothetical protein